jgi:hypothetical protein
MFIFCYMQSKWQENNYCACIYALYWHQPVTPMERQQEQELIVVPLQKNEFFIMGIYIYI